MPTIVVEERPGAGCAGCFESAVADLPSRGSPRRVSPGANATLDAQLAGALQQQAEALVAKAHTICPYSKATRGNIEVRLLANGKVVEGGAT